MINLHDRRLPDPAVIEDPAEIESTTSWSPVGRVSYWASEAGILEINNNNKSTDGLFKLTNIIKQVDLIYLKSDLIFHYYYLVGCSFLNL